MKRLVWLLLGGGMALAATRLGTIAHPPIRESSGLAVGPLDPERLWTLNDSGNAPVLFAIDRQGALLGEVLLAGAANRDWESLAQDTDGTLWVGDVGDNARAHGTVILLRLAEPDPAHTGEVRPERYELRWPDGAHDCEAMFVAGGVAYLVTKAGGGETCGVYSAGNVRAGAIGRLTRRGTIDFGDQATGADISRDGRRIAVTGYGSVLVWAGAGPPMTVLARPPHRLPLPFLEQTEALAFDGYDLLLTSEQRSLWRIAAADYERAPLAPERACRPAR